jgi:hypothetical protein
MKPEEMSDEQLLSHPTVVSSVQVPDSFCVFRQPDGTFKGPVTYETTLSCGHKVNCRSRQTAGADLGIPCYSCVTIVAGRYGVGPVFGLNTGGVDLPFETFKDLLRKARTGSRRIKAVPKRVAGKG